MRGQRQPIAVAAVDVGTSKVLAAIAVLEPDGLRVVGVGRVAADGVRRGAVVDLPAVAGAIRAAAERARRVAGRTLPPVTLGSAGGLLLSWNREAELEVDPPAELEPAHISDLLAVVRAGTVPAGYQIVHAIAREFTVDGYEGCTQPVGMAAGRVGAHAHVVACQSTLLHNLWKAAGDAGLEVEDFAVAGLAAAEAVLTDEERRQGALLLDIGAGASQVTAVIGGEAAASTVIGMGGGHVTADIAVGLGLAVEAAEDVKQRHANADGGPGADAVPDWLAALRPGAEGTERAFCEIVTARAEETVEAIARFVAEQGLEGRLPAGAVLTGGGSRLRGLPALVLRGLHLPVRCGGALGATGPLGAPECAAVVGLMQFAAQRKSGGRRLPPVVQGAGASLRRWWPGARA